MSIRKSPLAVLASISIAAAAGFALSACGSNSAAPAQDAASSTASAEAAGNTASPAAGAAGNAAEIKVNGSENDIHVNSAQHVSFSGSDNEIYYVQGPAPQIASDTGAENTVEQGR